MGSRVGTSAPAAPFWWGSATSAYQVEGGNVWSDWYEWERSRGLPACGNAVRHVDLFRHDFQLAANLGQNAHRLSLEWGRLQPVEGQWSEAAVAHYREVLRALRQLGFKISLTLNHFTLPIWFARQGGWESARALEYFGTFVARVVHEYAPYVDQWVTINEPLVLATEGYLYGHWPPGVRSGRRMRRVVEVLARAHSQAYAHIHQALSQAQVGLAHNVFSLAPRRAWLVTDRWAASRADRFWNRWLMQLTAGNHDFLGVNYYFHQRASLSFKPQRGLVAFADPRKLGLEISALGWEVCPQGLHDVLVNLWQHYHLPLYVTENGVAAVNEEQRTRFVERSVAAMNTARADGADVRGYFYWSLLDNFEWDKGFTPRFGLVEVSGRSFARLPRPAAYAYAALCRSGMNSPTP